MIRGKYATTEQEICIVEGIRRYILSEECNTTLLTTHYPTNMELLIYNDEEIPVGTGYVGINENFDFVIGGVAILPAYRRQKYGTFLMKILIDKALLSNAQVIYLDAFPGTEKFFENLNFTICGDTIQQDGTSLIPMKLSADSIHKCCCQ